MKTKAEIKEMKKLRAIPMSYREIGEKLSISQESVRYHIAEGCKAKHLAKSKQWFKDNRERHNANAKRWRDKNKKRWKKSLCLATVRHSLRQGILTEKDIIKAMKEARNTI